MKRLNLSECRQFRKLVLSCLHLTKISIILGSMFFKDSVTGVQDKTSKVMHNKSSANHRQLTCLSTKQNKSIDYYLETLYIVGLSKQYVQKNNSITNNC
jgi:hypothetical protein